MYKAIVIEDEPVVKKELVLFSPWKKAAVLLSGEASDGQEGYDLILKIRPDIVLTDIRMPGLDGLEMIEKIREYAASDSGFREPEWIILSGYTEFEYARTAMRLGVQEYLLKPVEEEKLLESLERSQERIRQKLLVARITKASEKGKPYTISFFCEYTGSPDDTSDYVGKAVGIIRDRYIQGVTIDEVAALLGISAGYLSRLFRKLTGYTFTDYLTYERISVAARLLKETDNRIYEIADLVGYEDSRYFSQLFKRVTGFTPKEFKEIR